MKSQPTCVLDAVQPLGSQPPSAAELVSNRGADVVTVVKELAGTALLASPSSTRISTCREISESTVEVTSSVSWCSTIFT